MTLREMADGALLLTIQQAASLLGIPPRRLYRMAAEGRLPGVRRIGRTLYLARPELARWLEPRDAENGPTDGPRSVTKEPIASERQGGSHR
jgi:excisionase family DNA binding protein